MKKRADQVKVGERVNGTRVEAVRHHGPMLGEAYGYARNVDIELAPDAGWMLPRTFMAVRGDILLNVS